MSNKDLRLLVAARSQWLKFVRKLFPILVLVASEFGGDAAGLSEKPLLSFRLAATNQSFNQLLVPGLTLRVERDSLGWEVGVFEQDGEDNLLYPQHNWHGAFPCQLYAWSRRTKTFPEERLIPIRGHKGTVRIRLLDAGVAGEPGNERFTGGRVEIYCKVRT